MEKQPETTTTDSTQEAPTTPTPGPPKRSISVVDDELPLPAPDDFGPPLPPDGGWGWVVVVASFCCNLIVDGVCYTFGIFYNSIQDHFQASKGQTALVGSMLPGMYLIAGPVVSALANKYGCRRVTISGGILASISFILSIFSPNITVMTITYGVMGGIGFGLMYLPSIVMVGFYFDRKRAMATGIAVCGSGIGTFVFAPLGSFLLETYGWKGANIFLAGIILNGVVCGALFRPLEARPTRAVEESKIMKSIALEKKRRRTTSTGSLDGLVITKDNMLIKEQIALVGATVDTIPEEDENHHSQDDDSTHSQEMENKSSVGVKAAPSVAADVGGSNAWGSSASSFQRHRQPEKMRNNDARTKVFMSNTSVQRSIRSTEEEERVDKRKREVSSPFVRQDIFFPGSVTSLREYKTSVDMASYVQSVTSIPVREDDASYSADEGFCVKGARIFEQMFDFSLLKSATFFVVCMSGVLAFLGIYTPFVYVTQKALRMEGVTASDASLIISILGICNTAGRLVTGWLADRPWSDCLVIHNVSVIVAGLLTCVVPALNTYELLCAYAALFGVALSAFIALRSIVIVELLGIQKLTNAFGLTSLFQGIAVLIGSPLTGAILEATGSFTVPFIFSGSMLVLSGLVCLPARRLAAWEAKRNEAKNKKMAEATKA